MVLCSCKDKEEILEAPFIEIELESDIINLPVEGGTRHITVRSNVMDLQIVSRDDSCYSWCTASLGITASENQLLTIDVSKNVGVNTREAYFTLKGTGIEEKAINIVQLGTEPAILTNITSKSLTKDSQEFTLEITSNIDYSQTTSSDWLKLKMPNSRSSEMETNSFTYTVSVNEDLSVRRDVIVITPNDENIKFKVEIPVEQEGADLDDVMTEDEKIIIKEAKNISGYFYVNCNVDKTIDGDYKTYFGSGTNVKDPVIIEYILADDVEKIDYVKFYQRVGVSSNNQLTGGIVEYKAEGSDKWIKCGSFDETEIIQPLRVDLENVVNPKSLRVTLQRTETASLVAFGEFECYKLSKGNDFDLTSDAQYFTDDVFSELKPGVSEEDINNITHPMVKAVAKELFVGKYQKEFRSRTYKSCKDPRVVAQELTIGNRSICDNPMGLFMQKDKSYVVFVSNTLGDNDMTLYIHDWRGSNNKETFSLKPGLNMIKPKIEGSAYIQYWTKSDEEVLPDVKVHMCFGNEIGFWDVRAGHTNADWKRILNLAVTNSLRLNIENATIETSGELVQLINTVNAYNTYCPNDIESVMKMHDDLMMIEYTTMGLAKNNAVPKNRMLGVRSWGGNPNWNGTCANYPNLEQEMFDRTSFLQGIWVYGHEFGHGNQIQEMKNGGWSEVTNNIYSQEVMYKMNNGRCRVEHVYFKRQGYDDAVYGDCFNAYLNDAMVKNKPYFLHQSESINNPDGVYYKGNPFVALAPLWQLSLFFMHTDSSVPWYRSDFWGDVIWNAINDEQTGDNYGLRYVKFMKRAMDASGYNLCDFFKKMGLLRKMDIKVAEYGPAKHIVINEDMVRDVESYGSTKPNIPDEAAIHYVSGNSIEIFNRRQPVYGTYGQGITDNGISKTISHNIWKNVVAYETYAGEKLVEICITSTGSENNTSTMVRYPKGSTRIEAIAWNGKKTLVYGNR